MKEYIIITDSTVDLPKEYVTEELRDTIHSTFLYHRWRDL